MKRRRLRKNLNLTSLFIKTLIFILAFAISAYLGIKIIVNILYFTSKFLPEKQSPQIRSQTNEIVKPSLSVFSLPEATNEAKVKAVLFSDNAEKIKVYLNDKLNKTISVEDENIEVEIDNLKPGKNLVYFVALLQKESFKTKEYSIVYDNTPPELNITSPENFETNSQQIEIKGTTEPHVLLKVNSLPIVVSQNGEFSATVNLKEGENTIEITAQDEAGNITKKTLTITRTSQ